jgi:hypothetical protein
LRTDEAARRYIEGLLGASRSRSRLAPEGGPLISLETADTGLRLFTYLSRTAQWQARILRSMAPEWLDVSSFDHVAIYDHGSHRTAVVIYWPTENGSQSVADELSQVGLEDYFRTKRAKLRQPV